MAKKLKVGDNVCWDFGGRYSRYYKKKRKLCGKITNLNPSTTPSSYEVKLEKKSIKLLKDIDGYAPPKGIITPLKDVVRKPRK
jgi:hypothetical protein